MHLEDMEHSFDAAENKGVPTVVHWKGHGLYAMSVQDKTTRIHILYFTKIAVSCISTEVAA